MKTLRIEFVDKGKPKKKDDIFFLSGGKVTDYIEFEPAFNKNRWDLFDSYLNYMLKNIHCSKKGFPTHGNWYIRVKSVVEKKEKTK